MRNIQNRQFFFGSCRLYTAIPSLIKKCLGGQAVTASVTLAPVESHGSVSALPSMNRYHDKAGRKA